MPHKIHIRETSTMSDQVQQEHGVPFLELVASYGLNVGLTNMDALPASGQPFL